MFAPLLHVYLPLIRAHSRDSTVCRASVASSSDTCHPGSPCLVFTLRMSQCRAQCRVQIPGRDSGEQCNSVTDSTPPSLMPAWGPAWSLSRTPPTLLVLWQVMGRHDYFAVYKPSTPPFTPLSAMLTKFKA